MRADAVGLFWDEVPGKVQKQKTLLAQMGWQEVFPGYWAQTDKLMRGADPREICVHQEAAYTEAKLAKAGGPKAEPPEPVWLEPDYLPYLKEALEFKVPLFTNQELVSAAAEQFSTFKKHELVFDIECYYNYFLIAFKSVTNGKIVYFEKTATTDLDYAKLGWLLENFRIIGFNSRNYDIPITALAMQGEPMMRLKEATNYIIEENERAWVVLRRFKCKQPDYDHIDLQEVAPSFCSLKMYGGRMHTARMQDLPFAPDTMLSDKQIAIIRYYCVNDLTQTLELYQELRKEIELRIGMSDMYGIDLRSKSDAQVAEAVLKHAMERRKGHRVAAPIIEEGTVVRYKAPPCLQFKTPLMKSVLDAVVNTEFTVNKKGSVGLPPHIKKLKIEIGNSVYKMGIGGLHSSEKSVAHYTNDTHFLVDKDVTSYYPFIILTQGLYPLHLGPDFLIEYEGIVHTRIAAKERKDKNTAESLKIVINGTFGKLGNKHSVVYSPDLMIQVTLSGQLYLMMLIEALELAEIPVVSGNTDGIVIKCPRGKEAVMEQICEEWQTKTALNLESTYYNALYSRDVNNYVAIKRPEDLEEDEEPTKTKGVFAKTGLKKNPQNRVVIEAVNEFLTTGRPIEDHIAQQNKIEKFVSIRKVAGGCAKVWEDGHIEYLGSSIRWYYSTQAPGVLLYAKTGHKVPNSEQAMPCLNLPQSVPVDLDREWYIKEAYDTLRLIGYAGPTVGGGTTPQAS